MAKILVACEESQTVTIEFRKCGHEAFSCDIMECSGGHPEWHLQQDVIPLLADKWDCILAFPPCTHLSKSGAQYWPAKQSDGRQQQGIDFFMKFVEADCKHIAIENPSGIMNTNYKKPDQIIHPYYFGDSFMKQTCLWLKNLPRLFHNREPDLFAGPSSHVGKGRMREWINNRGVKKKVAYWYGSASSKKRSKTFPGIAKAMAEQWGHFLNERLEGFKT